jgi:hypothetical protein
MVQTTTTDEGKNAAAVAFGHALQSSTVAVILRSATRRTCEAITPVSFGNLGCSIQSGNALVNNQPGRLSAPVADCKDAYSSSRTSAFIRPRVK